MNKIILTAAILISGISYSQIYTPTGGVNGVTTNGQTENVGIGTNNPQAKLEVNGNVRIGSNTLFQFPELINLGNGNDKDVAMEFGDTRLKVGYLSSLSPLIKNSQNAQILSQGGGSENLYITSRGNSPSKIIFHTSDGSGLTEKMRISPNGNIGIGVANPTEKLEILGNLKISYGGSILGNSNDLFNFIQMKRSDNTQLGGIAYDGWGNFSVSKKLAIGNLISMKDSNAALFVDGNVGIGTSTPSTKLDVVGKSSFSDNMKVNAKVEAKEIKVTTTPTADFVFAENYALPKLEEVEKHIKEKKHLPEIAPAKEMEKEGVNIGEFQIKLLQKIEELTLYSIEQNKRIRELEVQNKELLELKKMVQELKKEKNK